MKWSTKSRTKCFQAALQCLTEDFIANVYPEPWQTPKMELFTKIVEGWKLLTIFAKSYIFDVWQSSLTEFTYRVQYTSIRHSKLAWKKTWSQGVWEKVNLKESEKEWIKPCVTIYINIYLKSFIEIGVCCFEIIFFSV